MTQQAIISLAGKQFLVGVGDIVKLDKHVDQAPGEFITVSDVLMTLDGDKVQIGQPHVKDSAVTLEVLTLKKGPKVTSLRFKAKSRSRRKVGHRQPLSELKVTKIV